MPRCALLFLLFLLGRCGLPRLYAPTLFLLPSINAAYAPILFPL